MGESSWRFKSSHPHQGFPAKPGTPGDEGGSRRDDRAAKLVGVDAHDLAVFMDVFERLDDRKRGMYLRDHHEGD